MSWYYRKFPSHPVATETFKARERNNILLKYHYRVDPKLGEDVYVIYRIPCACPVCVAQLDKYLLSNISPSSQPRYAHDEKFYYKKYFNITMI